MERGPDLCQPSHEINYMQEFAMARFNKMPAGAEGLLLAHACVAEREGLLGALRLALRAALAGVIPLRSCHA